MQVDLDGLYMRDLGEEGFIAINSEPGWHTLTVSTEHRNGKSVRFNILPEQYVTRAFVQDGPFGVDSIRIDPGPRVKEQLRQIQASRGLTGETNSEAARQEHQSAPAYRSGSGQGPSLLLVQILSVVAAFVLGVALTSVYYTILRPAMNRTASTGGEPAAATEPAASPSSGSSGTGPSPAPTASPEPEEPEEDYTISESSFVYYPNLSGALEYHAFVEITNTSDEPLYLSGCTFDLEDDMGHLLQTDDFIYKCPDVIAPGEKGYFYNGVGSTNIRSGITDANGLTLVPHLEVEPAKSAPVEFPVEDSEFRAGNWGVPTVTGRITNTSAHDETLFSIDAIFYGKDGKPLGIAGTTITDFTAGKTVSFEISGVTLSNTITVDDIADFRIVARAPYYP